MLLISCARRQKNSSIKVVQRLTYGAIMALLGIVGYTTLSSTNARANVPICNCSSSLQCANYCVVGCSSPNGPYTGACN